MDPLTPAHLLYGRRITSLPCEFVEDYEVDDPTFGDESSVRRLAKRQVLTLQHFKSRWRHEYLTSLREYHKQTTGYYYYYYCLLSSQSCWCAQESHKQIH